MNRKVPVIGIIGLFLTVTSAIGFLGWYAASQRIDNLESQISELERKEKHATVLRSVSAQMEEIAYEQKAISDEKREEAFQQTRLAYTGRIFKKCSRYAQLCSALAFSWFTGHRTKHVW